MNEERNIDQAFTVGLQALAWTLGDLTRTDRMLAVTGLDTGDLRARAGEPALLAAILAFLEAHEPDLIACAEALDIKPGELVSARAMLEG
jgi:hypothetical protein